MRSYSFYVTCIFLGRSVLPSIIPEATGFAAGFLGVRVRFEGSLLVVAAFEGDFVGGASPPSGLSGPNRGCWAVTPLIGRVSLRRKINNSLGGLLLKQLGVGKRHTSTP
jgi:hypothetical protein